MLLIGMSGRKTVKLATAVGGIHGTCPRVREIIILLSYLADLRQGQSVGSLDICAPGGGDIIHLGGLALGRRLTSRWCLRVGRRVQ